MTAPALLARLEAQGVRLALNDTGDGLKVFGKGKPSPAVMEEVRAHKPALLAFLRGGEEKEGQPVRPLPSSPEDLPADPKPEAVGEALPPTSSPLPLALDGLPEDLRALVEAAQAGNLPHGMQALKSGLVPDLNVYVMGWAQCWPRDAAHVLRRLREAREVWKGAPKARPLEEALTAGRGAA